MSTSPDGPATRLIDDEGRDLRQYAPSAHAPGGLDIFTERGIVPPWAPGGHVARARGYVRWERDEYVTRTTRSGEERRLAKWPESVGAVAQVATADARITAPQYLPWLRPILRESAGWVMPRYSCLPEDDWLSEHPAAQLRPDVPTRGRTERHPPPWAEPGTHPHAHMSAAARRQHESSTKPGTGHLDDKTGELVIPLDEPHVHVEQKKYQYLPDLWARWVDETPDPHLMHRPVYPHEIRGYQEPSCDPIGARRYSRHPDTTLAAGDVLVIALEGILKCDALVSAGWTAVEVGSVTLWGAEGVEDTEFGPRAYSELGEILDTYQPQAVIITCDSDWYTNDKVERQAFSLARLVEARGIPSIAAAPPEGSSLGWCSIYNRREMREKLGVDDFYGQGGTLEECIARRPADRLADVPDKAEERLAGLHHHARAGARITLGYLLGRADPEGRAFVRTEDMATETGADRVTCWRRVNALERVGLVTELVPARPLSLGGRIYKSPAEVQLAGDIMLDRRPVTVGAWLRSL